MTWTKEIARYDSVEVDGTDVSNAFRTFNMEAENPSEDVTGFSTTGARETLPGTSVRTFNGEAFYTPELYDLLYPLFNNRTIHQVRWQPQGLVDNTREVYYGNMYLNQFNPNGEVGGVRVMTARWETADASGIVSTGSGT